MIRKKKQEFVRFKEVSCPALNVRTNTSTRALIIKVLAQGRVVECDKNFEDAEWDHIFAEPNIEGYCMKKYLVPASRDRLIELNKEPIVVHSMKSECDAIIGEENKDDNKEDK